MGPGCGFVARMKEGEYGGSDEAGVSGDVTGVSPLLKESVKDGAVTGDEVVESEAEVEALSRWK